MALQDQPGDGVTGPIDPTSSPHGGSVLDIARPAHPVRILVSAQELGQAEGAVDDGNAVPGDFTDEST